MKKRSRILSFGLPVLGLVSMVMGVKLVHDNRPVIREESPPRPPTTAPRGSEGVDMRSFIGALGLSEAPGESIAIAAHVGGVVASVEVAVGQRVEKGALLFRVDARSTESQMALRRSQVNVARADVKKLRAEIAIREATLRTRRFAMDAATESVAAALADLEDRQNRLRVVQSVTDVRAIATEEVATRRFAVQQAEARWRGAKAELLEAESQVAVAEAELRRLIDPETKTDGADIVAASERVQEAEREFERTVVERELLDVRSPVDGRVLKVNVRPGEFAPAATSAAGLVVLGRDGPVHLRVEIDEVDIARFSSKASAWASPRGNARQRFALEFAYLEPLVIPKSRLSGRTSELIDIRVLPIVYRFAPDAEVLAIGQQFDVYIEAATKQ